jgi:hypothetical protein
VHPLLKIESPKGLGQPGKEAPCATHAIELDESEILLAQRSAQPPGADRGSHASVAEAKPEIDEVCREGERQPQGDHAPSLATQGGTNGKEQARASDEIGKQTSCPASVS